jgi:hypothetical protein
VSGCCVDVNGASTRRDLELVVDKSVQLYINNETVEGSPFVKTSKNNNVMGIAKACTSVALLRLCWFPCATFLLTCVRNRTPAGRSVNQY